MLSGVSFVAAFGFASCHKSSSDAGGQSDAGRPVACLGRISPLNGIIHIAQPASSYPGPSPVAEVDVQEGDLVKKGQVIAILENRDRLETSWRVAQAQALVAEAQRAKVIEGGSPAEVAAQRAEVARLSAAFEAAKINQGRSDTLRKDSAIADVDFQATQLALETQQKLFEAAQQRLRSLVEVRDVDLKMTNAQYQAAVAEAEHDKAEFEQAFIRAPADGRVVRIDAHPGETIGPDGVEFAEINPLYVIAEVDESDAGRVRVGERATITGAAFPDKLGGAVERIGTKVGRNGLVTTDPTLSSDSRVVEVKIRLDDGSRAANFLLARVTVILQP